MQLNNVVSDNLYKKSIASEKGIQFESNIDYIILADMCNKCYLNENIFDDKTLNGIDKISDVIYDKLN